MDSESSTESEDYAHDESDDEYQDEDNSDLEDEFTTSFEKLSTVPRNGKKESFKPYLFSFDSSDCGLSSTLTNLFLETPLDFFELFFNSNLVETIVEETNRFHANSVRINSSHTARWIDTTTTEMYTFLATVMLMPHTTKNRIRDYWWSVDHLLATPIFAELFTLSSIQSVAN